jgi:hypothetical protein
MVGQIMLNNNESATKIFLKKFWDLNKALDKASFGWLAASQQYFSLTTNQHQPPVSRTRPKFPAV